MTSEATLSNLGLPLVAALIVNFNGGARVLRAVESLYKQQTPLSEIVVVDNHSKDGSPEHIAERFPQVRVVRLGRNIGLSAARNVGLYMLSAPLVLMLDHDVYVTEDCLAKMLEAWHREERPAVVCPRIRLIPERDIVQTDGAAMHFTGTLILRNAYASIADTPPRPTFVDAVIGAAMLLDREQVLDAGGFDELFFFYFEDLEFSMRLRTLGERIWCESTAEVFHERSAGTPGLSFRGSGAYPSRRAYLTMRNRLLTILIHYRLRTLLVLFPALLAYELATLAVVLRRGWFTPWARAWGWLLSNFPAITRRRRTMRRRRVLADRAILVGGPPPLAPGFIGSSWEQAVFASFSAVLNAYWALARRCIG